MYQYSMMYGQDYSVAISVMVVIVFALLAGVGMHMYRTSKKTGAGITQQFTTVTTLSKIIALALFVTLPFVGFYFGVIFAEPVMYMHDIGGNLWSGSTSTAVSVHAYNVACGATVFVGLLVALAVALAYWYATHKKMKAHRTKSRKKSK